MSKTNLIVVVLIVLAVVGFGVWSNKKASTPNYSIVYLTTGEVYVGELSTFPSLKLDNAYILQMGKDATDATKTNFQLNPISEALWAPKTLHLIEKNVVFYGPLLDSSKIAETLSKKK